MESQREVRERCLPVRSENEIDLISIRNGRQRLLNDVRDFDRGVRDQGVEVHPPDPVMIASSDDALYHEELMPHKPS